MDITFVIFFFLQRLLDIDRMQWLSLLGFLNPGCASETAVEILKIYMLRSIQ